MPPPGRPTGLLLAGAFLLAGCASPGVIPTPTSVPALPTPATEEPAPSASPTDAPIGTEYTVRPGDGLAAIARAYGTSLEQLVAWNAERYPSLVTDPGVIEPGWILRVSAETGVTPRPDASGPPQPTPPPVASGCTAGNRVAAGSAQTFTTIPDAGPEVALTFDMGGRMDPAVAIMDFLVANDVCATIFATGVMALTPQGTEVMAIIADHPELFEVANHTMYHCDLVRGGGGSPSTDPCQTGGAPSSDFITKELTDAEAILRDGTGQEPTPYWRPPYGSVNGSVIGAAAAVGYTKTFMWDIDTVDWKPISSGGPTAEQIAAKVVNGAVSGSNVLFHLGGYETLDALALILPGLRDRGFTVTSLSDLLN